MPDEGPGEVPEPARVDLSLDRLGAFPETGADPLRTADVGLRLIRGGSIRAVGYGLGMLITAAVAVFLLRYLGVTDYGRYATVASLIAIVSSVTDAGLSAVGGRDLAVTSRGLPRRRLLANILGLRLLITPLGVLAATAFAVAVGYDRTLVLGTVLAGIGLILATGQVTMTLPLSVDLKIGRLTVTDLVKQVAMLVAVAVLVAVGAGLVSFFAAFIAVSLVALAVTPAIVGRDLVWRPEANPAQWRTLIRQALPLAASVVMAVVYFRVLIVLMSVLASGVATGLFATSFRVTEILYGLSSNVLAVALPVLAVAAEDGDRLRYVLQRLVEVAVVAACYLTVLVVIEAEPVLELLGGNQYRNAAPVLRIQVFALIFVFLGQVIQFALISVRRQSAQAVASGCAFVFVLVLGVVLIPLYDATGAAIAALIAEVGFTFALLIFLLKYDRSLCPNFGFLWKVALPSGLATAWIFVPGLPTLATAVLATVSYAAGLWLTRLVPREVFDAFAPRTLR
jgi:O-antigen/teichoic acid export membrane protein